jgi:Outer membrane protein beta-barrel domain
MRRAIPVVILAAGLTVGASAARAGGLDLRIGAFLPAAHSNLFDDDQSLYFVQKSDFDGFTGGAEYNTVIARNVELAFHVDGYGRSVDTSYRDYTRPDGSEIYQTLHLEIVPFGVSIRLVPTRRRARIAPYLAAGPDLFYWKYEEYGDFIDFLDPELAIYSDHFTSDGVAFGAHVAGGLRYYVNRDFAVVVEGRYQFAKADMGGDFSPTEPGLVNRIDLGGTSVTVGLHVRF